VRPVPVVVMKPLGQVRVPGLGTGISVGIRPLVQQSADEPLHLPVHPWHIGRRGLVPDAQLPEHPLETLGLEDFGMIRHHRLNTDAHPAVVAQRGKQKGYRTLLPLVRLPLHVGQAAMSIHRSKDVQPAGRAVPILSVLGHPVPRPPEACELLGVQVQKHTRGLDLIAPGQGLGFQERSAVKARGLENPGHRALGNPKLMGDGVVGPTWLAKLFHLLPKLLRRAPGALFGS